MSARNRWRRERGKVFAALAAADVLEKSYEPMVTPQTGSFREFVRRRNPSLLKFEHVERLVAVAQDIVLGKRRRTIVLMPPRYFKSEIFSRLLPAYNLIERPSEHVGLASYGAALAWNLSRDARNYYTEDGGQLEKSTGAKKEWLTTRHGTMWAAGVGGPLLGFGYHLGIVDDPTDPEGAHSLTYQRRFRDWWPSKFLSRQEPNARIVIVMQRLGVEDPIDFLFRREMGENTEAAAEGWHVVVADEIRSDEKLDRWSGRRGLPVGCTLEKDDRPIGAVLAPSRFSAAQVKNLQAAAGPYVTSAQRQQRPMRPAGDFWQKQWFRAYDELPGSAYNGGQDWDTAYTKKEANSATARVETYRGVGDDGKFPIYIEDVDWDWVEFPALVLMMEASPGPHYVEQKATGKSVVQTLASHDIVAHEVAVKGDKFARAARVQTIVSTRRVHVRRAILDRFLFGERQGLLRVTAEQLQTDGEGLDLNDAFVQSLHRHVGIGQRRVRFR